MRFGFLAAVVAAALMSATPVLASGGKTWRGMSRIERTQLVRHSIQRDQNSIRWWLAHRSTLLTRFPEGIALTLKLRQCPALNVATPAGVCQHAKHLGRAEATLHQLRTVWPPPAKAEWLAAVAFADRVWPGSAVWLMNCSASEGGHGDWVPNTGGSGAGGWMQFLNGTFYGNVDMAFTEARHKGFVLEPTDRDWYSSVGQAVTAAWMYVHGGRGQWYGSGC